MKQSKDKASIQSMRALALFQTAQHDRAVAALQNAIAERNKSKEKLTHIYESVASYEYMIASLLEHTQGAAAAREAYARALMSDLSYYPAHVRLGNIAMAAGDTAAAISSFKTAADLRPNDAWIRYVHGAALQVAGRLDEATAELKKVTEIEPYFAAPYYSLARIADQAGKPQEAKAFYTQYLERASQTEPTRAPSEKRLKELAGACCGLCARRSRRQSCC